MPTRRPMVTTPVESVTATTSTGPGTAISGAFTQASMMIVRTSSNIGVQLQGSLNGSNWVNISAVSNTAGTSPVLAKSTQSFLVTKIRANVTTHTGAGTVRVWVAGA